MSPSRRYRHFTRSGREGHEGLTRTGRREASHARCYEELEALSLAELKRRAARLERARAELGLQFTVAAEDNEFDAGALDLVPRILRTREWEHLRDGVLQRARAFSAYVRDVYTERRIVAHKQLPAEVLFEDPAFHIELASLPPPENPIVLGAVDLVRTQGGAWRVFDQHFSEPNGLAFVLQNRRMLAQAMPELFDALPVQPVASAAARLAEELRALAAQHGENNGLAAMLSREESPRAHFEASFLARQMGIPQAKPADLLLRDGHLYLTTVSGLVPVTSLFRRLSSGTIDPVTFARSSMNGVPGLVHAVRQGTLAIANALGSGVADNRALLRYSREIISFYLEEAPLLPTVRTYTGLDPDQADLIAENAETMTIRPVCRLNHLRERFGKKLPMRESEAARWLLEHQRKLVVGQPREDLSRVPTFVDGRMVEAPVLLRVFVMMGQEPYVLPGGLSWVAPEEGVSQPESSGVVMKDTWVVHDDSAQPSRRGRERLEPLLAPGGYPSPSRVAESLYWLGRYIERGSGMARMLSILEDLRWGELTPAERKFYAPMWQAVVRSAGQGKALKGGRVPQNTLPLSRKLIVDEDDPAAVKSCFQRALSNAEEVREYITPEFWEALHSAVGVFPRRSVAGRLTRARLQELCEAIVHAGDRVDGTASRTLVHDSGWSFFQIGRWLERAVVHASILEQVLPREVERQLIHFRDETDLAALLRLLGGLDAYRREYRSRAYLDRVVRLIWQSELTPAAVAFGVRRIEEELEWLGELVGSERSAQAAGPAAALRGYLRALPVSEIFPARVLELDRGISQRSLDVAKTLARVEREVVFIRENLEDLHSHLDDAFFRHRPKEEEEGRNVELD